MRKFKDLSTNEKVLISFLIILLILIGFNYKEVWDGLVNSFKPYWT